MSSQSGGPSFNWISFLIGLIAGIVLLLIIEVLSLASYWFYKNRVNIRQKKEILDKTEEKEINIAATVTDTNLSELDNKILKTLAKLHVVKQSELPRILDEPRSSVSESLSFLENNKLIIKNKEGRTYQVELNLKMVNLLEK